MSEGRGNALRMAACMHVMAWVATQHVFLCMHAVHAKLGVAKLDMQSLVLNVLTSRYQCWRISSFGMLLVVLWQYPS
jgi:hypothetical protein